MSMTVKKGDNVVVITGKEKGKQGKVLEVFPEENRVLVDGVNIVSRHQKARNQQEKSGIVKKSAPIDASNVMVVCPSCGKATRVHHKEIDGKKVRVCKCGVSLDKDFVKTTKKDAKKAAKAETKEVKAAPKAEAKAAAPKTEAKTVKAAPKAAAKLAEKKETSTKAAPKAAPKTAEPKTAAKSGTKTTAKEKSTPKTAKAGK